MTDLQKTLAFLDDMGYNKLPHMPVGGKAGFRNYYHDRLFISVDRSSFTFNKDESLAGIGYGPPTYWKDEYLRTQREAREFYNEDYDEFFVPAEQDFTDSDDEDATSWDDSQIPDEEDDE